MLKSVESYVDDWRPNWIIQPSDERICIISSGTVQCSFDHQQMFECVVFFVQYKSVAVMCSHRDRRHLWLHISLDPHHYQDTPSPDAPQLRGFNWCLLFFKSTSVYVTSRWCLKFEHSTWVSRHQSFLEWILKFFSDKDSFTTIHLNFWMHFVAFLYAICSHQLKLLSPSDHWTLFVIII